MDDDTVTIPIDVGPQYSSGDPSLIPQGYCARVRNMLLRPKRIETRPPFVYDSLMSITGLANFDDTTNKVSRMLSFDSSQALYEKNTSGETHSASLGTVGGTRLTSLTNYRGKAYGMMETSGLPAAAFSFDGTTINTSPFNSAIQGRVGIAYLDRHFIIYPRVTINAFPGFASRYAPTGNGVTTVSSIVSGGTTTVRWHIPSGASGFADSARWGTFNLTAQTTPKPFLLRLGLKSATDGYAIPLLAIVDMTSPSRANLTAYNVGDMVLFNSIIVVATAAGTTAAAPPVFTFPSTVDGTVTWQYFSANVTVQKSLIVPSATDAPQWSWYYFTGSLPAHTNTVTMRVILQPVVVAQDCDLDIGYKDGLADGTVGKQNYGPQFTIGDFYYPFINTEATDTATVDMNSVIWSDILSPGSIRASATYDLWEVPGYPTAGALLGGRLLVFKRNAFWIFAGNRDVESLDVIPIRQENKKEGVGCIGPKAHDTLDNDIYFIGEDGVYRFSLDGGEPEEIGGDAMREEIIARGANWVESQTTYNQPILRANPRDRELYVYTQKGTIYVYNIARKGWTTIDVIAADGGAAVEVADMIFNPNTRKLYVAFGGHGLARLDWSAAAANDTINNSAVTLPVTKDLVTRPIEAFSPRQDATVDNIGVFHTATASQVGQELTAHVSFDRGNSYPYSDTVTLDISIPRNQIDLFESEPSITVKLSHVGKAGKEIWSVSKLDAELIPFGGEWPQTKPAPVRSVQ